MKNHRKLGWIAGLFTATLFMPNLYGQGLEDVQKKLDGILAKAQEKNRFVGLSVLAIDKDKGSFKKHYGFRDHARTLAPNDDTMYEIGSITKVFTRLALLAQDKIKPEDLLSKHLPEGVRVPKPHGQEITIEQLMTHTGSLRYGMPCVYRAADPEKFKCLGVDLTPGHPDPYGIGTKALTYDYITEFSHMAEELPHLVAKPGLYYEYSNAGTGLLGNLMEDAHGQSLQQLMEKSILSPLGMAHTTMELPCAKDKSCKNFAWPHLIKDDLSAWRPWELWTFPGIAGAGYLRSNLTDMEKFLEANMDPAGSPIAKVLKEGQKPRPDIAAKLKGNLCKPGQNPLEHLCNPRAKKPLYAWETQRQGSILFHTGGTGGSSSLIVLSTDGKKGVVVLGNAGYGIYANRGYHSASFIGLCTLMIMEGEDEKFPICQAVINGPETK